MGSFDEHSHIFATRKVKFPPDAAIILPNRFFELNSIPNTFRKISGTNKSNNSPVSVGQSGLVTNIRICCSSRHGGQSQILLLGGTENEPATLSRYAPREDPGENVAWSVRARSYISVKTDNARD